MTPARLGPYELLGTLGQGAAGTVYRARHVELGVERALKVVRASPSAPGRFGREVRALASVRHPNVVAVHEVAEGTPSEPAWLAMDLVEGEPLVDALVRGPLPLDRALDVVTQVARGLDALHAHGIVHRDVKPANVLLARDGRAVVVDLGMSRSAGDERLTRTGALVGTPLYLAPELLAGAAATPATDVHALGLLLYECATGTPAFLGADPGAPDLANQVLTRVASPTRPRPSEVDPGLPHALDGLCARALALDPRARPARAGAFADLAEAIRRSPGPSRRAVVRRRVLAVVGVAGVVGVVGLLARSAGEAGLLTPGTPGAGALAPPASASVPVAAEVVRQVHSVEELAATSAPAGRDAGRLAGQARADALLAAAERPGRAGRRALARLEHPAGTGPVRARFVDAGHVLTVGEQDGRLRLWALDAVEPLAEARVGPGARTLVVAGDQALVHAEAGLVPLRLPGLAPAPPLSVPGARIIAPGPDGGVLVLIGGEAGAGAVVRRLDPAGWGSAPLAEVGPDPGRSTIARLVASTARLVLATDPEPRAGLTGDAARLLALSLPEGALRREQLLPSWIMSAAADPRDPHRFALGLSSGDVVLSDLSIDDPLRAPGELRLRAEELGRDALKDAAHATGVRGVAFTPDGRRLVSVASLLADPRLDELRWWDAASGRPASDPLRPAGPLGVELSPDGRLLVVSSRGNAAEVWAVPP